MLRSIQRRSTYLFPSLLRALAAGPASSLANAASHITAASSIAPLHPSQWPNKRWLSSEAEDNWRSIRESFTSILVDVEDDIGIATVTINRPESLNALNSKVRETNNEIKLNIPTIQAGNFE